MMLGALIEGMGFIARLTQLNPIKHRPISLVCGRTNFARLCSRSLVAGADNAGGYSCFVSFPKSGSQLSVMNTSWFTEALIDQCKVILPLVLGYHQPWSWLNRRFDN